MGDNKAMTEVTNLEFHLLLLVLVGTFSFFVQQSRSINQSIDQHRHATTSRLNEDEDEDDTNCGKEREKASCKQPRGQIGLACSLPLICAPCRTWQRSSDEKARVSCLVTTNDPERAMQEKK
jgi:hypothetical protein